MTNGETSIYVAGQQDLSPAQRRAARAPTAPRQASSPTTPASSITDRQPSQRLLAYETGGRTGYGWDAALVSPHRDGPGWPFPRAVPHPAVTSSAREAGDRPRTLAWKLDHWHQPTSTARSLNSSDLTSHPTSSAVPGVHLCSP
jgi:hypothetical protein